MQICTCFFILYKFFEAAFGLVPEDDHLGLVGGLAGDVHSLILTLSLLTAVKLKRINTLDAAR